MFWNGVANSHLDELSFAKLAGPKFLRLVEPYLGGRHLDFGAGSGYLVKILLEQGLTCAAFDPAPERARKLFDPAVRGHRGFLGIQGFESSEKFDVVFLVEVVEHILDAEFDKVLRRVVGFVADGGTLIVTTPNSEDIISNAVYCPMCDNLFHPWQHVRSFSPSSLADCLGKYGIRRRQMALMDFSCDAILIEKNKKAMAMAGDLRNAFQGLAQVTSAVASYAAPIGNMNAAFTAMERQLAVLEAHLLNPDNMDVTPVFKAAKDIAASDAVMKIGKESTIVFVGQKV